ncbi:MAG: viroplasmin family protein [Acidobacteriota bacterium]
MAKKKNKFYAYKTPEGSGVVESWSECENRVAGRPARYKGFAARGDAEAWLRAGARYEDRAAKKQVAQAKLPEDAVYFDAGTGGGNGTEINVTGRDGVPLLHLVLPEDQLTVRGTHYPPGGRTNNYGELLACVCALKIAEKLKLKKVCGDSELVLKYWSRGHVSRDKSAADPDLARLAQTAARTRKAFESAGGILIHVPGGLNPSDLGFHRD